MMLTDMAVLCSLMTVVEKYSALPQRLMASFLGKCLLCMQCTCSNSEDDEHSTLVERVIPFYTLKARPGSQPRTTSASARTDIHPTCLAPSALVPEKGLA